MSKSFNVHRGSGKNYMLGSERGSENQHYFIKRLKEWTKKIKGGFAELNFKGQEAGEFMRDMFQ